MKTIKLISLCFFISSQIFSQISKNIVYEDPCLNQTNNISNSSSINSKSSTIIWSDDFSNPSNWIIDNSGQTSPNGWPIDSNIDSWYLSSPINSSSGGNFAEITNGAYTDVQNSTCPSSVTYTLTTASPIDIMSLANTSNVFISWEEYGAKFYDLQQVFVSVDSGLTWSEVASNSDYDRLTSSGGSSYNNPTLREARISSFISSNPSAVLLRFSWTSEYPNSTNNAAWITYGWHIDDISINLLPENDIVNESSWIYGENAFGVEYGRTPISQIEQNYYIGSSVYNYGSMNQNNILVTADFSGPSTFTTNASYSLLESDSTTSVESLNQINLSPGIYNGSFSISSDMDTLGSNNYSDNTYLRNFEITNDVYSIDGIGNHPPGYESLSSLGTNSFAGNEDGFICANMFHINQPEILSSVSALITNSQVGAEVILHIFDSTSFMNDLISPLYTSEPYILTINDINNGKFSISTIENLGWDPISGSNNWAGLNLDIGNYFFALEMFSYSTNDVRIVDDLTVDQPWYSSMIYLPSDFSTYSNGNAFAIRLNFGNTLNINNAQNFSLELFPNPANNLININLKNNIKSNYEILDISGKILLSDSFLNETQINSSNLKNGIYLIKIRNDFNNFTKRVTISD